MSQLSLLVLASAGAALAFFVAGLLLRRPRAAQTDDQAGSLGADLDKLRADYRQAADGLTEAKARCEAEAEAKRNETAARLSAERERDSERAEHGRIAARERTLADRLRAAEDGGRAALEQVESNASAWDARWQAAKAEELRQVQTLKQELDQLRARHEADLKEHQKLVASSQKLATERNESERAAAETGRALTEAQRAAAEAARALTEAQGQSSAQLARQTAALEEETRRLGQRESELEAREREVRTSVEQSAAAWRLRLEQAESEWQKKLASKEAEWRAQASAADSAKQSQADASRLSKELEKLRAENQGEREQRQRLELVARATEEALATEHASAQASAEAVRLAEGRLRDLGRLTEENANLRAERQRLAEEAKAGAGREGEAKDVKVELAAAQAKLAELGQMLEENRKLRDEVAELHTHQEATSELERLTAAHKELRLDAELMSRRLQELKHDQAELVPLRAQAAEAASLQEEVEYLRGREKDLEAQLYATGFFASREMPAVSGELLVQTPVTDMETTLDSLLVAGGPRTAVLADAQGFLIAGAGESMPQEGLAAFAAVAGDLVARARMLLPLADVDSVRLTDVNRMVLTCHLFDSDGQGLEIATLGPGEPPAGETERTIAGLAATLSSDDSVDKGAT